jgi:hypothetical protein
VQKKKYEPATVAVNVWVSVQGPVQVSPWPRPGRLNPRLCGTPASAFWSVAVTVVPAETRRMLLSNARFAARTVRLTDEARGGAVG